MLGPVSVICTVLNEAESIERLLASLAGQTRPPDQIVIVDGGSSDGTWQVLRRCAADDSRIVLEQKPGANISAGRNEAIRQANGAVIAVTDAGVWLEMDWLERLLAPFEREPRPDVVGGFFVADPRGVWETTLGATTLPGIDEIEASRFLPSSRSVAFTRAAWEQVGGYPEWLDYCEDLVFDLGLQGAQARFDFAGDAVVHFRPRPDPRSFFVQYFRYARGDGKALLWTRRHLIRYGTYLGAPALLLKSRAHRLAVLVTALGAAAYCYRPLLRLRPALPRLGRAERAAAIALVPVVRLVGDVAKMLGYPLGLIWRWRHRSAHLARAR